MVLKVPLYAVFLLVIAGCTGVNYRGQGALAGGALGGIAGFFGSGGHPAITAASTVGGALIGAAIGSLIPDREGVYERNLGFASKEEELRARCQQEQWNRTEQAIRYAQVYGGNPVDYYKPDTKTCDTIHSRFGLGEEE